MAGPTPDSANSNIANPMPAAGPGSQTPMNPATGVQTPVGVTAPPKPAGAAGAPPKPGMPPAMPPQMSPDELQDLQLIIRSIPTLILDANDVMDSLVRDDDDKDAKKSIEIETLVNGLLEKGWDASRLKKIISMRNESPEMFFKNIKNNIISKGLNKAIDELKQEFKFLIQTPPPAAPPMGGMPPMGGGAPGGLGGGAMPPPMGAGAPPTGALAGAPPVGGGAPLGAPPPAAPKTSSENSSDVYPNNISKRGDLMDKAKIIIENGQLKEVAVDDSQVLNKLAKAIVRTKSSVDKYNDAYVKFAGIRALTAADEFMMKDEVTEEDGPKGLGIKGEEGPEDKDKKLEKGLQKVKDGVKELESAIGGPGGLESALDETEGELGLGKDDLDIVKATVLMDKGREVLANAEAVLYQAKKIAEGKDPMGIMMGTDKGFKKTPPKKTMDEDLSAKEKKDVSPKGVTSSEEEKEVKVAEEQESVGDLVRRIKARLQDIRVSKEAEDMEKEAAWPPAKIEETSSSAAKPISSINATSAQAQINAIAKNKSQIEKDKDTERINPKDIADKTLSVDDKYKETPKKNVPVTEKKISLQTSEKLRKYSMDNLASKARLSVELAAQQQLKGLIDDPLKQAFLKNLIDSGIQKEAAEAIIHNSYIDGYEASQKAIIKEAFETFINKDLDDFVKVAKFVKDYNVREAAEVSEAEKEGAKKTASESIALRPSAPDKDKAQEYKGYWQDVERRRKS